MRDLRDSGDGATTAGAGAAPARSAPTVEEIRAFQARLGLDAGRTDDATRIDRLRALEQLRCTTEAAQAETTADFAISRRQAATDRGVRPERRDRGLASQVALARRESPHRGQQHVSLAMVLRTELPCTRAAFRAGRIDAWKATLIARETACLSAEHRAAIDQHVAGEPDALEGYSVGQLIGHLTRWADKLDPAGVAERRRRAQEDRHTSIRPAPDTMTWFSALLSVKDGVGVHATLDREARRLRSAGDERTLAQLRADLLVEWILHPELAADLTAELAADLTAEAGEASGSARQPVMVHLTVPECVLFGDTAATGWVDGYGPVPGDLLREWIADHLDPDDGGEVTAWVRRVYANPSGGLIAMDSRAEYFTGKLAEFLRIRDQHCRTPWCDARIRHTDHVVAKADGGLTTADNGQGLCERCNYAKQADGWTARPRPGPRHTVETTTPTGHTYTSVAPSATTLHWLIA